MTLEHDLFTREGIRDFVKLCPQPLSQGGDALIFPSGLQFGGLYQRLLLIKKSWQPMIP